jgi:hypothetical protein
MAKKNLGKLAGLAALAGAAYMMSKGKDKDKGSDSNPTRAARPESTETRLESPEDTIKRSMVKNDSKPITEADVVMPEKAVSVKSRVPAAAVADNTTGIRMPSGSPDAEAGMTRGTRSVPNDNYSNEGRSSARAPSTVSSSAEGMKNYKPRRNSTPANTVSSSAEGMKNYKPRVTPPAAPFRGGQPGYDEAGNFLGGRRGYDEAGNPMKKGGKVKKMASGGMTASSRADGIATRGKTKCKMY